MEKIIENINLDEFAKGAEALTLAKADTLIGKTIRWTHPCDPANQQVVYETKVGSIQTEYEIASRIECKGYESRAAYWDAKLPKQAGKSKKRLIIVDDDGDSTGMFCDPADDFLGGPAFCCSDADRYVTFRVVD